MAFVVAGGVSALYATAPRALCAFVHRFTSFFVNSCESREMTSIRHFCSSRSTFQRPPEELPKKPKKPGSPYFCFVHDNFEKMNKIKPDLSPKSIICVLAKTWKTMDEEQKKQYNEMFQEKMVSYYSDINDWYESLTEEEREMMFRIEEDTSRIKRGIFFRHRVNNKISESSLPFF